MSIITTPLSKSYFLTEKLFLYLQDEISSEKIMKKIFFMVVFSILCVVVVVIGSFLFLLGFWQCDKCENHFWLNSKKQKLYSQKVCISCKVISEFENKEEM